MSQITKSYIVNVEKNWYPFGRFVINKNSLMKGILSVRYASSISKLRTGSLFGNVIRNISNGLVELIINTVIQKERFDMSLFFNLSDKEQHYVIELMQLSGYGRDIGFNFQDAYKTRFKVLQGELAVGNDNPELRKEAKDVIKKLISYHVISYSNGQEMLSELENTE